MRSVFLKMNKKHFILAISFIIFGFSSAKAEEIKLSCYTLKGHPQKSNFLIDTEKKIVRSADDFWTTKKDYEIVSWSSNKITFRDKSPLSQKVIGHMSYSIDRVNLDYFWYYWDSSGNLGMQLFGKCELPHTKPQF